MRSSCVVYEIWLVVPADTVPDDPRMNGMFWLPRMFEQSLRMPPPAASPPLHFTIWLADGSNVNSLTVFVLSFGLVTSETTRFVTLAYWLPSISSDPAKPLFTCTGAIW